ncbi:MAG: CRISPR-associated protein Cas4 [Proteobacteria bacterium]|nr:CRISPR-associated protein Cas4 [Pseudomonadota bacterium]MBU1398412.1 CRISPR-associated protein Cas4 [Pseudomonadota bacterium]
MTYKDHEDDLIMLSALQHMVFCPRQCALIHIEQVWAENRQTAEGRIMHERVHEENRESRGNLRVEYGVPLRSLRLGLIGKADIVEFHRMEDGTWQPFPVEYKRGKPKADDCDKVQLCAQALCLEEMLNARILKGALFYGKTRRRLDVSFDEKLRQKTEETARNVRVLLDSGRTPLPVYTKKCESCSLVGECLPKTMGKRRSVKNYLAKALEKE